MEKEILFRIDTILDFTVFVDKHRWELITTQKHPVMKGQENVVQETIAFPDEVRRSKSDESVFLFYKTIQAKRWVCAVVKSRVDEPGFLITAYPTDAIKEGEIIWKR
ncbi:DUF4258 domain-containing protein [Larkinella soli]|uniref:DUF4258 domain-containing protein n=1 Tax=Larkinella soli TaxID=1770527 RepID=UPI000FFC74C6|nr:DUF4258 domain-containing protein [Larkinella soli]